MAAIPRIDGLSIQAAWKEVRAGLKRAPYRDVLDHLEYDIDHEVWISRLLDRIESGEYTPEVPRRCSVAKSKGFDRIITIPAVPDLVLYRAIVDHIYTLAEGREVKHAYFAQSTLSKVIRNAKLAAEASIEELKTTDFAGYPISSKWVFLEWLKYDQYRKLLVFEKLYPYIVITDISNFFDSVLHSRVEESLYELQAPSRMVSLLFYMLESFSLRDHMTPVQRIGLPVDPCDCSRVLAHMMLLPHDLRVVSVVGEDAYVRWMDDQNMGVRSLAEGLRTLAVVGESLRKIHLTPNSSKTNILSLVQAKKHFHFRANSELDGLESMPFGTIKERATLAIEVAAAWERASRYDGHGEWSKVLKRFYRVGARARFKMLMGRVDDDLLKMPSLTDRIIDYVRYVGSDKEFVAFIGRMLGDSRQVYSDVGYQLVGGLLLIDPGPSVAKRIREFAVKLLNRDSTVVFAGVHEARALAPLLLLRYGTLASIQLLFDRLAEEGDKLPVDTLRAICAVVGGSKRRGAKAVQLAASELLRNHLSQFVKLLNKVREFENVPERFRGRVSLVHDSIASTPKVDMRAILAARILGLSGKKEVVVWLKDEKAKQLAKSISDFDRRLLNRLWPAAGHHL